MAYSSLSANNNTKPTASFHPKLYGTNIEIKDKGLRAVRHTSFDNGVTFTSKPIPMNERVYMKIVDIDQSNQWLGSLAVGFTQFNPDSLQQKDLCKSALPNLCHKTGTSYLKRIFETLTKDIIITFYYNQDGAFYILDGKEHELCRSVNTQQPLWGVIDIYGNVKDIILTAPPQVVDGSREFFQKYDKKPDKLPIKYYKNLNESQLQRIGFLDTHGPEIELFCQDMIAFRRSVQKLSRPYLFFDFPMAPGDEFYIRILSVDSNYRTAGFLGFTNAERIVFVEKFAKLPSDDPTALYDRREFWILTNDAFPDNLSELDEYRVTFEKDGDFRMCRNNDRNSIRTFACGDPNQTFYPFFFLNGRITALTLMGIVSPNRVIQPNPYVVPTPLPDDDDANQCQICCDARADLVFVPCGHVFFCSRCKSKYEDRSGKQCPVCRNDYQNVLKIA